MSVYIDRMEVPFGRMIMSHMVADTSDELHRMADVLGIDRKHCQCEGTWKEHYDICQSKKRIALNFGAIEVSTRTLLSKMKGRRDREQ